METIDKNKLLEIIEERMQELRPTNTGKMQTGERIDNDTLMWLNALTWVKKKINDISSKQTSSTDSSVKIPKPVLDEIKFDKWIINKGNPIKIVGGVGNEYVAVDTTGKVRGIFPEELRNYRLWTIEDARHGELIFNERWHKTFILDSFDKKTVTATISYVQNGAVSKFDQFPKYEPFSPASKEQQDEFYNVLETYLLNKHLEKECNKKWTIKDAKTNDLIFNKTMNRLFIFSHIGSKFINAGLTYDCSLDTFENESVFSKQDEFFPATKSQYNTFHDKLMDKHFPNNHNQ